MANKYRFYPVVARDTVDIYLDYTLRSAVNSFVWVESAKVLLTRNGMEGFIGVCLRFEFPKVPQYVATLLAVENRWQREI